MCRRLLCDGGNPVRSFLTGNIGNRMRGFDNTNLSQPPALAVFRDNDAIADSLAEQRFHRLRHRHGSLAGTEDIDVLKIGK